MSGGVPKRISISRTQRNTPSKAGNVIAKRAIILCNGGRSRTAMCNYVMKRTRLKRWAGPGAGWTLVKDANFRSAVQAVYPGVIVERFEIAQGNFQTYFKNSTINTITDLGTGGFSLASKNISDLTGISGFTALTNLNVSSNNLTALDVTSNTALATFNCSNNTISTLDVSLNTALATLDCHNNTITALDVGNAGLNLIYLDCRQNSISTLDVSLNTALATFNCSNNQLNSLNVSLNTQLTGLYCSNNTISALDVSANAQLVNLDCHNNTITALDVGNAGSNLLGLQCGNNSISTLDVTSNTNLWTLGCGSNNLTALDVTSNTALQTLECDSNQLNTLDVGNAGSNLLGLQCGNNQLNTLDVTQNTALQILRCKNNNFTGGGTSVIITAFTNTYSGLFEATPQNTGINPSGDFCKVADAAAVTHFINSYPVGTKIPAGTNYFS